MARPRIMSPAEVANARAKRAETVSAASVPASAAVAAPRDSYYPSTQPSLKHDMANFNRLKALIAAKWPGHQIEFRAERAAFDPSMRHARFDLRSDMINGLPRAMYEAALAKMPRTPQREAAREAAQRKAAA